MEHPNNHVPKPSEFMRARRPYLYSDSQNKDAYRLSQSELSHQLDSLADRNQHKDFEHFARKVCEREICPNLRPQTGPEGGGDGKVDTETYPVDSRIAERWYVGDSNGRQKKWAFAFSAKKAWSDKVRSDVKGIVETKRGYTEIVFVTSRPARARDRLRIEDELKTKYGVPVTILDREWLIDRVFEHNHKDLAFEHLNAGNHDPTSVKLGPRDFERQQVLDEIDDRFTKLGDEIPDRTQAVSDTFEAASLSRRLEKPRHETEGRFLRAINFAKRYGANYQLLRAIYELAWTRFWWFDDVDGMLELYEDVEQIAFDTGLALHISKVCNLHQLIVGRVANGLASSTDVS
ncbi:MAG: tetratricopeptide repeat protein, partial [Pseudomonadota bacterium]